MEERFVAPVEGELPLEAQLLKLTNRFMMVVLLSFRFEVSLEISFGFLRIFDPKSSNDTFRSRERSSSTTMGGLYTSARKPVNHNIRPARINFSDSINFSTTLSARRRDQHFCQFSRMSQTGPIPRCRTMAGSRIAINPSLVFIFRPASFPPAWVRVSFFYKVS
jgi:hypothetical protein